MRRQPAGASLPSLWLLLSSPGACVTNWSGSPTHLLHSWQLGNLTSHQWTNHSFTATFSSPSPPTISSVERLRSSRSQMELKLQPSPPSHPAALPPHISRGRGVKRWFRRRSRRRSGCCERVLQLQLSSWQLLPASLPPPAWLAWPALGPSVCHGAQQLVRPLTQLRSTQPRHF